MEEILAVMTRLVAIREIVLRVNLEYIHSAAQADEFRTEPPFRLQGSYRNMNRLAEKVVPIMNEQEVADLVLDHYRGESQTLATGAESNLLKFKELVGRLSPEEGARWEEIKRTFRRNQTVRGADQNDPVSRVVAQLAGFQTGLDGIQQTLEAAVAARARTTESTPAVSVNLEPVRQGLDSLGSLLAERLSGLGLAAGPGRAPGDDVPERLDQGLAALREELSRAITEVHSGAVATQVGSVMHELEMIHSTLATLKDIAARQRDHVRNVEQLLTARAKDGTVEIELTQEMLANERAFLERFHQVLSETQRAKTAPESPSNPSAPPNL